MPTYDGTTGNDVINLIGGDWTVDGMGGDDVITTGAGNDTITGGTGIDIMRGGAGNDIYDVDNTNDQVIELAGGGLIDIIVSSVSYTLSSYVEVLDLSAGGGVFGVGNDEDNTIIGNGGANTLVGGKGNDSLDGGGGNDLYYIDSIGDVINENGASLTEIDGVISSVTFDLSASTDFLGGANFLENLQLTGTANLTGTGNALDNSIAGNAGSNKLFGASGDDTLDGAGGADIMDGGLGDDHFYVNNVGDIVVEAVGEGLDTVHSSISYTLGLNVENLYLTGTANINGTASANGAAIFGNSGKNVLTGSAVDDILDGGAGADRLVGGDGDDIYVVDNAGDVVIENLNEGQDNIIAFATFTLGNNIEILTLAGTANINGTGNALDNILIGNAGDNSLDGKAGADTMAGGGGNDTYFVDVVGDFVDEILNQGTDTVRAAITYTLTTFVENLVLTGTDSINGTGNTFDNVITGNSGNNTLDGAEGVDTLIGGTGNDFYIVDDPADVVTELAGQGIDTVQSSISYVLGNNIENLELTGTIDIDGTGNSGNNTITGNVGDNTLDGGAGSDILAGGKGNDSYVIDAIADIITENPGEGTDTVFSAITYTLAADLENLVLTGTNAINGTGNGGVNTITGNDAANTLDGAAGADTMSGGDGDDVYVADQLGDIVIENAGEGTDTVRFGSLVNGDTYVLAANVENIILTGAANLNATGNAGNNTLTGNAGANVLTGGDGDDTYVVDSSDTIVENPGEGTDTVLFGSTLAGDTYVLGGNLENLTLTGTTAINGTGDGGDNTLTGNSAVNTLTGGAGNDTYYVGTGDVVVENAGEGTDTVVSGVTFALTAGGEIENLTLSGTGNISGTGDNSNNLITGNSGNNTLSGLDGDDTLDGGAGNDRLLGGDGDDTYYVDSANDVIVENAGQGFNDTVHSTAATYTLSGNIEFLILDGTGDINGVGSAGTDDITGNDGNNSLDGAGGADILFGGLGDDTYGVDSLGDIVIEGVGAGNDTIRASITYSIAALANIENLVLTGTAAINGTGNAGDNTLVGNSGVNTLTGGLGDDTYIITSADLAVELAGEGTDTLIVTITSGTYVVPANFENIILIGNSNVGITGDGTSNTLTGNDGRNTLDGGGGADVLSGGKGQDAYIVDNSADVIVENPGEGTDKVFASADYTLSANVEHLVLTGIGDIDGTGNNEDNSITGNEGDNTLDGGVGTDKLNGGKGDDAYVVDTLRDVITDSSGFDAVFASISYVLKNGLEVLDLTGTDDLNGAGNNAVNILAGNDGANILLGLGGNDFLIGGGTYLGGMAVGAGGLSGNDTLDGGSGADSMAGLDGDDVYFADNAGDVIIDTALDGGDDILFVAANFVVGAGNEIENILIAGTLGYSLVADGANNIIVGNKGGNDIQGLGGNDTIGGGLGNDRLDGGGGDDTLFGDEGQNFLTGGTGADTFMFEESTAFDNSNDQILDFVAGDGDVIDISDLLGAYDPLTDTLTDFVRLQETGSNTLLRIDADGAANGSKFVTIAVLQDVTGLTGEAALVLSGNLIVS